MANSSTSPPPSPVVPGCSPGRCIGTIHLLAGGHASPDGVLTDRAQVPCRHPEGAVTRASSAYIWRRARTTVGGGLRAPAARAPRRCARGPGRAVRGLRRESVPLPGREVPRGADRDALPHLPPGGADAGQLRLRRRAGPGVGAGEDADGTGPDGRRPGRVLRVHRRGLPRLRLEPPRPLLRPGCRAGAGTLTTPDPPPDGDRVVRPRPVQRRTGLPPALGRAHS